MRARAAVACAAAGVIIGCAGCSSGPAHPQASHPRSAAPASPTLPDRALLSPGCSTATAKSPLLSGVAAAMVPVSGHPFGVAVTPDGRWAFVADGGTIDVLRTGSSLTPVKVATTPVQVTTAPAAALGVGSLLGETLTSDGRYVLAATGGGAAVVSVARAEQGRRDAVLGTMSDPTGGSGAIEVAVSPDGDYAFVTQEDSLRVAVFNLHRALTAGFGPGDFAGTIPVGIDPVGMAISPDGRWLYVTSEVMAQTPQGNVGTLTVVSVARADNDPAASVVATVAAGCNPVRVITSADGREVWVTARASDDLLCFSAAALRTDPGRALMAIVRVGEAPVGLMLVRNGSLVVVADSNRFGASGATSDLSVVSVAAALAGKSAAVGLITAGLFPREMALEPDGQRLLVTNFASGQLEAVSIPSIP